MPPWADSAGNARLGLAGCLGQFRTRYSVVTLTRGLRCGTVAVQAVTFLVIHQKHKKSLEEITNDLCPVLSVQQLYRISTMYWDDRYNTETVSHEVQLSSKALNQSFSHCTFKSSSRNANGTCMQFLVGVSADWSVVLAGQVLGRMKQLMVDNNTAASHSFLLDDDSSIPFSLDDIQNLMDEKARDPPPLSPLLRNSVLASTMPI